MRCACRTFKAVLTASRYVHDSEIHHTRGISSGWPGFWTSLATAEHVEIPAPPSQPPVILWYHPPDFQPEYMVGDQSAASKPMKRPPLCVRVWLADSQRKALPRPPRRWYEEPVPNTKSISSHTPAGSSDDKSIPAVVYVHGLNEHGGRADPFVSALTSRGVTLIAPDLEGHGHSGRRLGMLASFKDTRAMAWDVACMVRHAEAFIERTQDLQYARRATMNLTRHRQYASDPRSPWPQASPRVPLVDGCLLDRQTPTTFQNGKSGVCAALWGFSAGGKIAILATAMLTAARGTLVGASSLKGTVCHAPLLQVHSDSMPPWPVAMAAKWLSTFAPNLAVVQASQGNAYSPGVAHRELRLENNDELVYNGKLRLQAGLALQAGMISIPQALQTVFRANIPLLIQHGLDDRVCDVNGTIQALDKAGFAVSTAEWADGRLNMQASVCDSPRALITYKHGHHDLVRERSQIAQPVITQTVKWIEYVLNLVRNP